MLVPLDCFSTHADSVAHWLQQIKMDRYLENLCGPVTDVPTLRRLTDTDLAALGISIAGHRKRLQAAAGLTPPPQLQQMPLPQPQPQLMPPLPPPQPQPQQTPQQHAPPAEQDVMGKSAVYPVP